MSTEREIVDLFQDAFEKGNIGLLDPYLTEDMTYKVLPTTAGKQMMTKPKWLESLSFFIETKKVSFKMERTNIIEHPLFVVLQSNNTITFPPDGIFTQEALTLFHFSKDKSGQLKIASVVEYVDSFKLLEWKKEMVRLSTPAQ